MIHLKAFEQQWFERLSETIDTDGVGLLYLDNARFSTLEAEWGRMLCEQILQSMKQLIHELLPEFPAVFAKRMVGDDFFLFVNLSEMDVEQSKSQLEEWSSKFKIRVESGLQALYPLEPKLELQVGSSMLHPSVEKNIDDIVYSAMKKAIRISEPQIVNQAYAALLAEFNAIIEQQAISTVYQPIVSLSDASVFGYEALTRGPEGSSFYAPLPLFEFAERVDSIYELDKLARERAIENCSSLNNEQRVFINILPDIIHNPQFTPGQTLLLLEKHGLHPKNVVFEITERSSIKDFSSVKRILQHYRNQGYQIAIDDAGAGYSSLQAIAELQPDYIKVDRSLIQDIHKDKVKEYILETFVTFAQKMNIRIIAEGIESMDELMKLMRMGVHYAQGYLLGRPSKELIKLSPEIASAIERQRSLYTIGGSLCTIGDLSTPVKTFVNTAYISTVAKYFKKLQDEQGVVIVTDGKPVGLVMRNKLFQQLASQYGVSLYWLKSIENLMDPHPLIVGESLPVEKVSQMAMSRDINTLYDLVIITKNGRLTGMATVRLILEAITNVRMENARVSNPLTGLPGNLEIQREINRRLFDKKKFAVVYIDLDYFKWFNDQYGFQKGDQLIQYTADLIQQATVACGHPHDFVGHIGGDDFIVVSSIDDVNLLCEEIIHRFDRGVLLFADNSSWTAVEDRNGNTVDTSGVSISLSLIICQSNSNITLEQISQAAAILKKDAKTHKGSVYYSKSLG